METEIIKNIFMKKIILGVLFSLLITGIIIVPQVSAITENCPAGSTNCLTNPLGSINTPQALIGKVINAVLGVVGSLALLIFVYGGLIWMTSSGSPEKIKQGRDTLLWAAIGLVVIFSAYGLTRVVLSSVMSN